MLPSCKIICSRMGNVSALAGRGTMPRRGVVVTVAGTGMRSSLITTSRSYSRRAAATSTTTSTNNDRLFNLSPEGFASLTGMALWFAMVTTAGATVVACDDDDTKPNNKKKKKSNKRIDDNDKKEEQKNSLPAAKKEVGDYHGMRVLCIGCSSGIGKAAAELLLQGGAKVVVSSRTQSKCNDTIFPYYATGRGHAVAGNCADKHDMEYLVVESRRLMGGTVSHLVFVPTSVSVVPLTHHDTDELLHSFTNQMDINVLALVRLFQLLKTDLVQNKGAIVVVSSVAADMPVFGTPGYCAAKAAQNNLVTSLALEVGREGVRVNSVSPAVIQNERPKAAATDEMNWRHLLNRMGTTNEVGHTIVFLLDNKKAGFITGQNIIVDGGQRLMTTLSDLYSDIIIPAEDFKPGHLFFTKRRTQEAKKA